VRAQNNFRYNDNLYDIDYTAVPTTWAVNITVTIKNQIKLEEATNLLNSFLVQSEVYLFWSNENRMTKKDGV
jgi:hypothetical protein